MTVDPRRPPDPNRLKNCVNAAVWADELLRTHNPPDLDLEILDNWFARALATATSVTANELDNLDEPIDVVEHPFKGTWVVDLGPVVESTVTDPRLQRLRQIEAAAHGRWRVGRKVGRTLYAQVSDEPSDDDVLSGLLDTREDALLAATARNILSATIELLEGIVRHDGDPDGPPCGLYDAALAVLDQIGEPS